MKKGLWLLVFMVNLAFGQGNNADYNGSSREQAVVMHSCKYYFDVVSEENAWLSDRFGLKNKNWRELMRQHLTEDGNCYDLVTLALKSKENITIYFDITASDLCTIKDCGAPEQKERERKARK